MPKYLVHGSYVGDGVAGLLRDGGTSRRDAVEALVSSLGGSLESLYYAFGDTDVFVVVDLPDNVAAAAASLTAGASGAVAVKVTPLLTAEEIDEATRRSGTYRPPGG